MKPFWKLPLRKPSPKIKIWQRDDGIWVSEMGTYEPPPEVEHEICAMLERLNRGIIFEEDAKLIHS